MNCYLHSDANATAFCRDCGRALCLACQRPSNGTVFCQEHLPVPRAAAPPPPPNPYQQTVPPVKGASPGLAFALGFIPGVGAIFNGQYAKGLVHAAIVGLLISFADATNGAGEGFIAMIMVAFWGYMVFEAYHTAKKRQLGLPVDEFSSLISPNPFRSRAPIGPILLIAFGVVFLLDTLHIIVFRDIARFWPALLIVAGFLMLTNRLGGLRHSVSTPPESLESGHEQ